MKCEICKQEFEKNHTLSCHINKIHNIDKKEYYDTYLKQHNEGICPICGKETKFKGIFYRIS
jgi:hypothetical protein